MRVERRQGWRQHRCSFRLWKLGGIKSEQFSSPSERCCVRPHPFSRFALLSSGSASVVKLFGLELDVKPEPSPFLWRKIFCSDSSSETCSLAQRVVRPSTAVIACQRENALLVFAASRDACKTKHRRSARAFFPQCLLLSCLYPPGVPRPIPPALKKFDGAEAKPNGRPVRPSVRRPERREGRERPAVGDTVAKERGGLHRPPGVWLGRTDDTAAAVLFSDCGLFGGCGEGVDAEASCFLLRQRRRKGNLCPTPELTP